MTNPEMVEVCAKIVDRQLQFLLNAGAGDIATRGMLRTLAADIRALSSRAPADTNSAAPSYDERLVYECRILAAECGTQRVLNGFEAKLRQIAQQAQFNHDAYDLKAAQIITNIANMIREIDVTGEGA